MTQEIIVPKYKWRNFWNRAEQFNRSMRNAYENGDYDSCVTNAVHCSISSIYSLGVLKVGRKYPSEDCSNSTSMGIYFAVCLLDEVKTKDNEEKSRVRSKLKELLEMREKAEYECEKNTSKVDAKKAMDLCTRIFEFVKKELS